MDELERPEVVIPKDILVKVGIGIVAVGLTAMAAKFLWDKFGKKATYVEETDIYDGPSIVEGKMAYVNGKELTGFLEKESDARKVALSADKPPLEKLAYDKIAASYGDLSEQEKFGVPFAEEMQDEEKDDIVVEENLPEDVGEDNGRFEHGPNIAKPEGYETNVGTYFTTDDILAGFNDDLFDVNSEDYIGVDATRILKDMKRRSDNAYYVLDRDRKIWYEILINRLDTYDDGYLEWVQSNRRKGL